MINREHETRVVHLPARTPYAWKLQGRNVRILNNTSVNGETVPADVDARWLIDRRPLTWFDVLHIHHIEFEDQAALADLLDACAVANVAVAATAHDIGPMFTARDEHLRRLRLIAAADARWVCLTRSSMTDLLSLIGPADVTVIPHGYVAAPETLDRRERHASQHPHHYLLFGALRPNRDHISTIVNWSLGISDRDATLQVLVRAFSPADFRDPAGRVPRLLDTARSDSRVRVTMRPYPTDDEIIEAGLQADALLLPYLWGSHSGQLELAFDLNLLPVCSSIGYLHEQYELHKGLVAEPEWFDWSSRHPYLFGERFLTALEKAADRLVSTEHRLSRDFLDYRREEHVQIMNAFSQVYGTLR